ncbi:MAG TPA: hypothetical protein VMR16_02340 [Candidatus Saccharimonadales bacterium]|nr:hypothetical protein [Candidatus Saccharimonadales bacterium]
MRKTKIVNELKASFPSANIILNNDKKPTEIVAEVDPDKGMAVAVIDKSIIHHHNHTTEKYIIQKGTLDIFIDGIKHTLEEGDETEIKPGQVHYANGNETWVKTVSTPPWSVQDHILEVE